MFLFLGLIWTQLLITGKRLLSVCGLKPETPAAVVLKSMDYSDLLLITLSSVIHSVKITKMLPTALMWAVSCLQTEYMCCLDN